MIDTILDWIVRIAFIGQVTFYADSNIFEQVRINRGLPECHECIGFIALMECDDLGHKAYVYDSMTQQFYGPLMVADCAAERHKPNLRQKKWIADISYSVWHETLHWPDTPTRSVVVVTEETVWKKSGNP